MAAIILPAVIENFDRIMEFMKSDLTDAGITKSKITRIMLAAEEAIVNVIHYAYPDRPGTIKVECKVEKGKSVKIIITDRGIEYNPLAADDPDITLPADERQIGGLGVLLIKKIMDEVEYKRSGKKNVLTLLKYLPGDSCKGLNQKKGTWLNIRTKILLILLGITLISLLILGLISLFFLNDMSLQSKQKVGEVVVAKNVESIEIMACQEAEIVSTVLKMIEKKVDILAQSYSWSSYTEIIQFLKVSEENNEYIDSFYFLLDNGDLYTSKGKETLPEGFVPLEREWYLNALNSEGVSWTKVYNGYTDLSIDDTSWMITCSKRMYDSNGKPVGVLACDVTASILSDQIINRVENFKNKAAGRSRVIQEESRYSFIMDGTGRLIGRPEKQGECDLILETPMGSSLLEVEDQTFTSIVQRMINEESGFIKWECKGTSNKYVAFDTAGQANLTLGVVVDEDDITGEIDTELSEVHTGSRGKITVGYLASLVVLLTIVSLIAVFVSGKFVRPIVSLVKGADLIGEGNLDYELKLDTGDEFELLADKFTCMAVNLKKHSEDLRRITADNEKMETQISLMNTLQLDILPRLIVPENNGETREKSFDWLVPYMEKEEYREGDIIFKKEDNADRIYYLVDGMVRFEEYDCDCSSKILFGETGIFSSGGKRTATAVLLKDPELYSLDNEKIRELVPQFPDLLIDMIHLSIQRSVGNLKTTLEAKQRIESDLKVAAKIQNDMLPRVFPPFPEHTEFDIFASMKPAKMVGGDFYDFFFINEDTLCFVIADVSGKGIPASLFMVISKTLIKTEAMRDIPPGEILGRVNNLLFEENDEFMFVTVFLCIINIKTGEMHYANAGHNPPLLTAGGGDFEYLPLEKSKVVGVFKDYAYQTSRINLARGDKLFLYTDGVTEAMNQVREQYSDERLKNTLAGVRGKDLMQIEGMIQDSISDFVENAEQSDDITILIFEYKGAE